MVDQWPNLPPRRRRAGGSIRCCDLDDAAAKILPDPPKSREDRQAASMEPIVDVDSIEEPLLRPVPLLRN